VLKIKELELESELLCNDFTAPVKNSPAAGRATHARQVFEQVASPRKVHWSSRLGVGVWG
jgi:hypothetical protein